MERFTFTAWGRQQRWSKSQTRYELAYSAIQTRGYTGHEMLDALDLVHMDGRVYDPNLGRMLSGDPIVGDTHNMQRYNRYAYVNGNPLNSTDPSGYYPKNIMDANVYTICAVDSCAAQMGGWAGYNGSAARNSGGISGLRDFNRGMMGGVSGNGQGRSGGAFAREGGKDPTSETDAQDVCVSSSNCLDPSSSDTESVELSDEERIMQEVERYGEAVRASGDEDRINDYENTDVIYDPNYSPPEGLPEGTIAHGCYACGENGENQVTLGPDVLELLDENRIEGFSYHGTYYPPGPNAALDVIAHEFGHTSRTNSRLPAGMMREVDANQHVRRMRSHYRRRIK